MKLRIAPYICSLGLVGCTSSVGLDVKLVDPCNQENTVNSVDFIRLQPRGEGINSDELTTTERVDSFSTQPVEIPLAPDFHMVATGHRPDFDSPASVMGVSGLTDLSQAKDSVSIKIPFALLDKFYKTTSLDTPDECTNLQVDRFGGTATYLSKIGKVLIVGGARLVDDSFLEYPRAVELFDPADGTFQLVAELRSGGARRNHSATELPDGRVLISGGESTILQNQEALKSAFIIDARDPTAVDVATGGISMNKPRTGHRSIVLPDGKVVLIGGRFLQSNASRPEDHLYEASIEVYDPEAGAFLLATDSQGNAVNMTEPRFGHSAVLLSSGNQILISGGMNSRGPVTSVEVLTVDATGFRITSSSLTLKVGAIFHAAALAENGAVLLSGGYGTVADAQTNPAKNPTDVVEMLMVDEAGNVTSSCVANMRVKRGLHTVSMIGPRAVFVGGRDTMGQPLANAEVAQLTAGSQCFAQSPTTLEMADARAEHSAVVLGSSGEILVLGGRQQDSGETLGRSIVSTEIFSAVRAP